MKNDLTTTALSDPSKQWHWITHLIGWGVVFILPFLFTVKDAQLISPEKYFRIVTMLFSMMIVFYLNYFYFVKRFLFRKQSGLYLLSNFVLITGVLFAAHSIDTLLPLDAETDHFRKEQDPEMHLKIIFFVFQYIPFMFVAGLGVAFKMTSSWYKAESERQKLEKSNSEAKLQNLKSQLNPHFLFNTLNNIYSLIAFSPDKAQEAVHELSRLLRYVLYESNEPTVSLSKELNFIRNYVELMHIRLPENVELKTTIDLLSQEVFIAPLLFITPIENAFKHGVSNNKPSFIHIEIKSDDQQINCTIRNSYFPKNEQDKSGSGIGLENLRTRLALLYPDRHRFECKQEGDCFYSFLSITL